MIDDRVIRRRVIDPIRDCFYFRDFHHFFSGSASQVLKPVAVGLVLGMTLSSCQFRWLERARTSSLTGEQSVARGGELKPSTVDASGSKSSSASAEPSTVKPAEADPATLITPQGIGLARLGMTLAALKQHLGPEVEYRVEPELRPGWDAIAILQSGQLLYSVLYPSGSVLNDTDPIQYLMTENPRFQTPEGVGPGMLVSKVTEHYGQLLSGHSAEQGLQSNGGVLQDSATDPIAGPALEGIAFAQQPEGLGMWIRRTAESLTDARIVSVEIRQPLSAVAVVADPVTGEGEVDTSADPAALGDRADPPGVVALSASVPLADATSTTASAVASSPVSGEGAAAQPSQTVSDETCQNPNSQQTLSQCARQTLARSEALQQQLETRLNAQFPHARQALVSAQAAWQQHRLADCTYQYRERANLPGHPTLFTACQTAMTEARGGELRTVFSDEANNEASGLAGGAGTPQPSVGVRRTTANPLVSLAFPSLASEQGEEGGEDDPRWAFETQTPFQHLSLAKESTFSVTLNCSVEQSDLTLRACTEANFQLEDQSLQRQTQRLRSDLSAAEQSQFRAMQETWRVFRQRHCDWLLQAKLGGVQAKKPSSPASDDAQRRTAVLNQCLIHQTQKRQITLSNW